MKLNNLYKSKVFRWIVCPILLLLSLFWLPMAFRLTACVAILVAIISYATLSLHRSIKFVVISWIVFVVLTFIPFDISLRNHPGPPRIVPLVMGYPGPELLEPAQRGDIICGGCSVTGFEPKWVLVW
jgi:hypothetical protein